jgi:hypothetical protein
VAPHPLPTVWNTCAGVIAPCAKQQNVLLYEARETPFEGRVAEAILDSRSGYASRAIVAPAGANFASTRKRYCTTIRMCRAPARYAKKRLACWAVDRQSVDSSPTVPPRKSTTSGDSVTRAAGTGKPVRH